MANRHRHTKGKAANLVAMLSGRFQITIPKAIRDEQQWHPGQVLAFIPKGNGVLLMPVPEFEQLRGIAEGADTQAARDRNDRY